MDDNQRIDNARIPREEAIKNKIREAELYLRQGLFADAEKIYAHLIGLYRARLTFHPDFSESTRHAIEARIAAYEKKIGEITEQAAAFECTRVLPDHVKPPEETGADTAAGGDNVSPGRPDESMARDSVRSPGLVQQDGEDRHAATLAGARPSWISRLRPRWLGWHFVCAHSRVFLVLSLLVGISFGVFNLWLKTVNNVDYFKLENDPDMVFYDQVKAVFGNDEFFVIAFAADPLFSAEPLAMMADITGALEEIEEIDSVTSLTNVDDIIGAADYFEVRPFIEEIPTKVEDLDALKAQATHNYLYVGNLVSANAMTAAIMVEAYDRPEDADYRKRLLDQTDAVLSKYRETGTAFFLGGWTTTNFSLSQYLKADMMIFIPATYVLIALVTWLFFRNITLTLLAVVNISMCLGATRGLMGLTGIALNNVTSIVIPLVMALSLCDSVHIFAHMDKHILDRHPERVDALTMVLRRVGMPCFLTTLTTAVGFLSLSFSEITPIKEFAWIASSGMVFEFFFSFFLLPPLLLLFDPCKIYREQGPRQGLCNFIGWLNTVISRYHKPIVVFSCILVVLSLWLASQVRVETNLIDFFKKSSPVRVSMDFVEKRLSGVGTLDISLKADAMDTFKEPENLRLIERIQQYINALESVDKTMSFVDFLKDMNASFHNEDIRFYTVPASLEMVSQYLLVYDADDIEDYVNTDYDHARILVRISEHSSGGQKKIVDKIQSYIDGIDHPGIDIRVTGRAVTDVNVIDALVRGQIVSLSTAALVISLIMFVVFRSFGIACLSMIPNFFPIILNFGIMGAFDIPLDTGTALISAVALGIAVDDTIHYLSEYQRQRAKKRSIAEALQNAAVRKGHAIISSSVILCIGFGVMVFSRFVPMIHFGLLSAIIMITALAGDLVVLPAIMLARKKGGDGKKTRDEDDFMRFSSGNA